MNPPSHLRTSVLGLCAIAAAPLASAQIMLSPTSVLGTDLGTYSPESPLENMINQSGVEVPFVSGTTIFDAYFTQPHRVFAMNGATNNWQSEVTFNLPLHGYVDFDLGSSRLVQKLAIWNVTGKDLVVRVGEDPSTLGTAPIAGQFVLINHSSYPFSYAVDVLPFSAGVQGRYVRLDFSSAHLLVQGLNFTYAILGEVVASVAPVASPTLSIATTPDGGAVVTFSGKLQSTDRMGGNFSDVPGNPSGIFAVPQPLLQKSQFFRAVEN